MEVSDSTVFQALWGVAVAVTLFWKVASFSSKIRSRFRNQLGELLFNLFFFYLRSKTWHLGS